MTLSLQGKGSVQDTVLSSCSPHTLLFGICVWGLDTVFQKNQSKTIYKDQHQEWSEVCKIQPVEFTERSDENIQKEI